MSYAFHCYSESRRNQDIASRLCSPCRFRGTVIRSKVEQLESAVQLAPDINKNKPEHALSVLTYLRSRKVGEGRK